ncbi:hypothetical protein D3C83_32730 [compost metagenome]
MAPDTGPPMLPIMRHVSPWQYSCATISASRSPSRCSGGASASLTTPATGTMAFKVAPLFWLTNTEGIAIDESAPPMMMMSSPP